MEDNKQQQILWNVFLYFLCRWIKFDFCLKENTYDDLFLLNILQVPPHSPKQERSPVARILHHHYQYSIMIDFSYHFKSSLDLDV